MHNIITDRDVNETLHDQTETFHKYVSRRPRLLLITTYVYYTYLLRQTEPSEDQYTYIGLYIACID